MSDSEQPRSKKTVTFDTNPPDVFQGDTVEYFERDDVWYSLPELDAIAARLQKLVVLITAYPALSSAVFEKRMCRKKRDSVRGLDHLTPMGQVKLKMHVRDVRRVVFAEQATQKIIGVRYPEATALAYGQACAVSVDAAREAGEEDSRQARAVMEEVVPVVPQPPLDDDEKNCSPKLNPGEGTTPCSRIVGRNNTRHRKVASQAA